MIRLWIISCKLNPSHKINALNSPQFYPPTPPPKSELPCLVMCPWRQPSPLFLQITFPSSVSNWLQVRGTGGSWEMQNGEERREVSLSLLSVLTSNSKQWLSHLFSSFHSVGCSLWPQGNTTPSLYPSSLSCNSGFLQVLMSGFASAIWLFTLLTSL